MNARPLTLLATLWFSASCSPATTQPHAMSAEQHENSANREQASAEQHQAQFDPTASATEKRCTANRGGAVGSTVCWESVSNPTAEHAREADQYRELAMRHREASEFLRSAESSTCGGVPEEDRDLSPFSHRADIRSVSLVKEEVKVGKASSSRTSGATIVFRAVPGMTAEWLQRVVDCHLARNSAIGHAEASTEMPHCPLTLKNAEARVQSVGDGFAVTIRSNDNASAAEIAKRASLLKPAEVIQ